MKWLLAALMMGFLPSAIFGADDAKTDLKRLEGTWKVVSVEAAGNKVNPGKGAPEKIVIKDGKLTLFAGGKALPTAKNLKIEIDPKKKPKTINLVRGEKESLPGIYEVKKDKLKLALPLISLDRKPGEKIPRPKSFETKDKPVVVLVAKRSQK